ncbi:MAG: hypothetical protein HRU38_23020 [Saccharospirillaceae bacterium]|nr:hypothetical protein [Pseudomonadales bacterium]NRB81496.1 hypothetical protein [Saccharospirillaceae bacterium]
MYVLNTKRYDNPKLLEHLASHYVLGCLTTLVRNRVEKLAKELPQLREQINMWQIRFESMHKTKAITPPVMVWQSLQHTLFKPKQTLSQSPKKTIAELFNRSIWKLSSGLMALMLIILISIPSVEHQNPILGYTASMFGSEVNPEFVINIYKDEQAENTFIKFLSNQRIKDSEIMGTLWAKGFENDELIEVGNIKALMQNHILTKAQWVLIKNSKELIVTENSDQTSRQLFEGICVQLGDWG